MELHGDPLRFALIVAEILRGDPSLRGSAEMFLCCSTEMFRSDRLPPWAQFPVDASIVERMNAYGRRTLDVIAELNDYGVAAKRMQPKLVWSVQSFNLHNLYNSQVIASDCF